LYFLSLNDQFFNLKNISIHTASQVSQIFIGEKWTNVKKYLPDKKIVIITDNNLHNLYGEHFPDYPFITIEPGEDSKRLEVIGNLTEQLLRLGTDRSDFILGIGGGVVCDITGFLASIYLRGVRFGFISTSLLSQVDASVGGKNGVNAGFAKNILGTFNQPDFVICDPEMLHTLPEDDYLSGLAELVKMAVILDPDMFGIIEKSTEKILQRDTDIMESLVYASVGLKASVVREDEKERGIRMILNFGHTFGHVIETLSNQKHGLAIASGMVIAAYISQKAGHLSIEEKNRIDDLIFRLNLVRDFSINPAGLEEIISRDKKKYGDEISFIMVDTIGKAVIRTMSAKKLMEYYNEMKTIA
jgi:3-dehydroquinate synthase